MKISGEVRIDAPPAVVWSTLEDLASAPDYVPYLATAEPDSAGPLAVGSTARLTFRGGSLRAGGTGTVTYLAPPQQLAIRIDVPQFSVVMDVTVRVAPEGAASRVSELVDVRFTNPLMSAMGQGMLQQRDPAAYVSQGLERLKRLVEAGS